MVVVELEAGRAPFWVDCETGTMAVDRGITVVVVRYGQYVTPGAHSVMVYTAVL